MTALVTPADRRAAVELLVPTEHQELLAGWVETGNGPLGYDIVGEQAKRAAQAFADHRAAAFEAGGAAEREACCLILASAEANTKADQLIDEISKRAAELPADLAGLLADWCEATADELAELQQQIRARGAA